MQDKTINEIWGDLGRLRWGVVIFIFGSIGVSFTAGKQYGEQGLGISRHVRIKYNGSSYFYWSVEI